MKNIVTNPRSAALTGFVLALPLGLLYTIAVLEIEPLNSLLKPLFTSGNVQTKVSGLVMILTGMLLLPVALAISLRPVFHRGADGKRKLYPINLILAAAIVVLITFSWGGFVKDVVNCEILRIPNCD